LGSADRRKELFVNPDGNLGFETLAIASRVGRPELREGAYSNIQIGQCAMEHLQHRFDGFQIALRLIAGVFTQSSLGILRGECAKLFESFRRCR
jgi:hypothetical protein